MMLSANAIDQSQLLEGERLYDDYVMKPIDLRQLLKKIHALLDIEWTYEPELALASGPPAAQSQRAIPCNADIDELIRLGEIGHVRKILDFVQQMRTIVNTFDLRRYAVALEAIRGSHA
jgi:CheY-like chemotaxis protein